MDAVAIDGTVAEETGGPRVALKLPDAVVQTLRCPVCKSEMRRLANLFHCLDAGCRQSFPIIDGVPILLNEATSVFRISDLAARKATTVQPLPAIVRVAMSILPQTSHNIRAATNYRRLAHHLLKRTARPRVLVVGGAVPGEGLDGILADARFQWVETDVYFGNRTKLIADAHDLPFADGSYDGVIAQAVLEHVADPYRCVAEMHRVLGANGLVYAETPFMQQVHLGRYDFTRFTHLGHRRLFRQFDEISSGIMCGPGMALAWAGEYFLLSFSKTPRVRALMRGVARLTLFWLKYFDYYLCDKPGALDAASGYYFLGKKSSRVLSDRDLIKLYRGAIV